MNNVPEGTNMKSFFECKMWVYSNRLRQPNLKKTVNKYFLACIVHATITHPLLNVKMMAFSSPVGILCSNIAPVRDAHYLFSSLLCQSLNEYEGEGEGETSARSL